MYSCHLSEYLLLLLGPHHFSPLLCSSLYGMSLGISNFLKEIFSLSHSIVFFISLHCSLKKAFLSLLSVLWNSAFRLVLSFPFSFTYRFSSQLLVRTLQPFFTSCISFPRRWFCSLPPVRCYDSPSIVLQVLYQI